MMQLWWKNFKTTYEYLLWREKQHNAKIGNISRTGMTNSKEMIEKLKETARKNPNYGMRGRQHTEESKMKNRLAHLGKKWPMKRRVEFSYYRRALMDDPNQRNMFAKIMTTGQMRKPTKLEQKFIDLCKKYVIPFEYVGDGKVFVGFKNPDFIFKNKIIEVFSWHHTPANKNILWHQTEDGCKEYYNEYNYKTLVLWDREFRGDHWEENVALKVKNFINN